VSKFPFRGFFNRGSCPSGSPTCPSNRNHFRTPPYPLERRGQLTCFRTQRGFEQRPFCFFPYRRALASPNIHPMPVCLAFCSSYALPKSRGRRLRATDNFIVGRLSRIATVIGSSISPIYCRAHLLIDALPVISSERSTSLCLTGGPLSQRSALPLPCSYFPPPR